MPRGWASAWLPAPRVHCLSAWLLSRASLAGAAYTSGGHVLSLTFAWENSIFSSDETVLDIFESIRYFLGRQLLHSTGVFRLMIAFAHSFNSGVYVSI